MGPSKAASPSGVSPFRSRRLLWSSGIALAVIVALLVADFILGRVLQSRTACPAADGVTVNVNPAQLPLTSVLLTGSIGSVDAFIPWPFIEARAAANSPAGPQVRLSGDGGLVVAEAFVGPLPIIAILRPQIDGAGNLDLSLVSLNVAGRDVPPGLAEEFGNLGGVLQEDSILGGLTSAVPSEIESLEVRADGLAISARLPLAVLNAPQASSVCRGSST